MKALAFALILAAVTSAHAQDSFEIVKNGRNYLCTEENVRPPTNPGDAVDCAKKAYAGPFTQDESIALCSGARDMAPADCAIKAYAGPFGKAEAITLCTGAWSMGPAECGIKAYAGPFGKTEAVTLCRDNGSIARADCAIRAYAGPYNKDQAIALCLNQSPALTSVGLKVLVNEHARGFESVLKSAMDKAAVRGELSAKVPSHF